MQDRKRVGPLLAKRMTRALLSMSKITGKNTLIVFSMQIVAPDEKRPEILRVLGRLLGPTRAAAGCLQAHLYSDVDTSKTLLLVEEWESRGQFELNLDATRLNTIVAVIELSSEAPVVRVDMVEREEGIETLGRRH